MKVVIFEEPEPASANARQRRLTISAVPQHLLETPWLEFQQSTALALCDSLADELTRLCRRPTAGRVHDTRVALRRFFSVWGVLKEEGWQTKKFKRQVAAKLRELLKALGKLRDWDVNLEMGADFGLPERTLEKWAAKRKPVKKAVKRIIAGLDPQDILCRLRAYLVRYPDELEKRSDNLESMRASTYERLDRIVEEQEKEVRELEAKADGPEGLHRLRLGIKRWRYLMTEFFGLTNLELVRAQQLLGRLNDYERLETLLKNADAPELKERLKLERERLLKEFEQVRRQLPYGLRPVIVSVSPGEAPDASEPALLK